MWLSSLKILGTVTVEYLLTQPFPTSIIKRHTLQNTPLWSVFEKKALFILWPSEDDLHSSVLIVLCDFSTGGAAQGSFAHLICINDWWPELADMQSSECCRLQRLERRRRKDEGRTGNMVGWDGSSFCEVFNQIISSKSLNCCTKA